MWAAVTRVGARKGRQSGKRQDSGLLVFDRKTSPLCILWCGQRGGKSETHQAGDEMPCPILAQRLLRNLASLILHTPHFGAVNFTVSVMKLIPHQCTLFFRDRKSTEDIHRIHLIRQHLGGRSQDGLSFRRPYSSPSSLVTPQVITALPIIHLRNILVIKSFSSAQGSRIVLMISFLSQHCDFMFSAST